MADRSHIAHQIAALELRLAQLDKEKQDIEAALQSLRRQTATGENNDSGPKSSSIITDGIPEKELTPTEKVELFIKLFRGRADVYPRLWENRKTGKKGYSPACANEWARGVCEKPRVKCGECNAQSFLPVTPDVILDHLQGKHVIGTYPLLPNDSCWFLAVDFDKQEWQKDVQAFSETCQKTGISCAIERSRSGNGAHAWFFFSRPIPAASARKMGAYLITLTMERRHQLDMASYDRLFPNQDTMPSGGFGNLIALPLQLHARQHGNTLFLDDALEPLADQWAYLASLPLIGPEKIECLTGEATSQADLLGLHAAERYGNEHPESPWLHPSARHLNSVVIRDPAPASIKAVLSQRLFIAVSDLPAALINQLKRLAAFPNPEFYKKQNLRLSTALTPRIIACAQDHDHHISLPRGCLDDAQSLIQGLNSRLELEDLREPGDSIEAEFRGKLTDAQTQAAQALLAHDNGILVAPPGFGKTVLGAYLIAKRKRSTLILVHRQPLLEQWRSQISIFLGIDSKSIGQIGGGKRKPTAQIDVAMIQSLSRKDSVDDIVTRYGQVIVDECHHLSAVSFERVLSEVKAHYIVGLTATPQRRDGHQPIIHMQIGPTRFKVDPRHQASQRPFDHRLIIRETNFEVPVQDSELSIQALYNQLATDESRNQLIIDDVLAALDEGRSPIVLTERKEHLETLHERLRGFVRHIVVLRGGLSTKARAETASQLAAIPQDQERLLLATGRYIGEGFDDARLDTLFLALPVSWKGTLVQYAGRLHRLHPGKRDVRIVDYVDRKVPMLARMHEKRLIGYRAMGYLERADSPLLG